MKKVIQLNVIDIIAVYGYSHSEVKNNEGKMAYFEGKLEKCNIALLSGKPENFRCYLDTQNQKKFDVIMEVAQCLK